MPGGRSPRPTWSPARTPAAPGGSTSGSRSTRRGSSPTTRATRPSARASSPRRSSAAPGSSLISDAGTPVISDPGYRLIRTCIERDLEIEVLPGPSAVTTALVASGLPADRWRFEGFLPRRAGELERVLQATETVVAFESPRRLPDSLAGARRARARPPGRRLPRADQAARGGRPGHALRARAPLPRTRSRARSWSCSAPRRRASGARTRPSRSTRCAAWSSRAPARAPPPGVVAALTGTRPNELYRELTGREPRE